MTLSQAEKSWDHSVPHEAAVSALASCFARTIQSPLVIFLEGELGAGKTLFARAFIQALGYSGYVKSPTYGLLESYAAAGKSVLHLDLYRIEDPEELDYLALRDLFDDETVMLVEWPDKGIHHLPPPDLQLLFSETLESRVITCVARSDQGQKLANEIKQII
jgi:tRNA threonylcarbamoyladenosine biosynthesis protein TsaE